MDWKNAAKIALAALWAGAVVKEARKKGQSRGGRATPEQQPRQALNGTIWDDDYVAGIVRGGGEDRRNPIPIPTEPPEQKFLGTSADGVPLYTGDAARLGGRNGAKVFLISGAGHGRARYVHLDDHGTTGFGRSDDTDLSSLYSDPDPDFD